MIRFVSAIIGFVAVALGAFGAHALSDRLDPSQSAWWDTATLYLLVHAALATAISVSDPDRFGRPAWFLVGGATVFAATLYAMALGAPRWLGAVTPVGGIGMLAGWALTAWAARKA